ncbi:lysozyme g-like [Betta splendens]|uniref:Lysozyme g-like n=1 Tax=Betta splendens TaxID=158456 RepID=A0A9W2XRE2_BETSP|nr:lysozyme g-like [Betta splendens]
MGCCSTKNESTRAHSTPWDYDLTQGENPLDMTEEDLGKISRYRNNIEKVSKEKGFNPGVIAAITPWDKIQMNQNPEETLRDVTEKLDGCIRDIRSEHPRWTKKQQLEGGIAAYKAGPRKVPSYDNRNEYTNTDECTDGNYSNDVLDQAKSLNSQFFGTKIYF